MTNENERLSAEGLRTAVEANRVARADRTIPAWMMPSAPKQTHTRAPGMTIGEAAAVLAAIALVIVTVVVTR